MNILQALLVRRLGADSGLSSYELAHMFNISQSHIQGILKGDQYQDIPMNPAFERDWQWDMTETRLRIESERRQQSFDGLTRARRALRDFRQALNRTESRICPECGERKSMEEFPVIDSRGYRRKFCSACW